MNLLETFKEFLFSQEVKPSKVTVKNYLSDINHFIRWYESYFNQTFDPKSVTHQTIEQYKQSKSQNNAEPYAKQRTNFSVNPRSVPHSSALETARPIQPSENPLSPRSVERHLSSLRKFFTFLKLEGQISVNPFEQLTAKESVSDPWKLKGFKSYLYVFNASHLTIKNYLIDIKQFLRWAGEVLRLNDSYDLSANNLFEHISGNLLEEYKQRLLDLGSLTPATINRKLSSLRKYTSWLEAEGLIGNLELNRPLEVRSAKPASPARFAESRRAGGLDLESLKSRNRDVNPSTDGSSSRNSHVSLQEFGKPEYSGFPPYRLLQKVTKGINLAVDATLITQLVKIIEKAEILLWKTKGMPVFVRRFTPIKNLRISADFNPRKSVSNIKKELYAPLEISTKYFPWYKKAWFSLRYKRPNWYKTYHSYAIVHYFHFAVLVIFAAGLVFGFYTAFVGQEKTPTLAANIPTSPNRILNFQGRLTDASDNPITSATNLRFSIYTQMQPGTGSAILLWQEVNQVAPDTDGIFNTLLGNTATACANPLTPASGRCSIPSTLFSENNALFLGVTVEATPELTPRQQLATVAFASNSETLQGLLPITATAAGTTNVVLALDSTGNLTIGGSATPTFQASGGQFKLSGQTLVLTTNAASNGNIQLAPDGTGRIDLTKPLVNTSISNNISSAVGSVEVDDLFSILATSSGQSALTINQTGAGPLISASASGANRFAIDNSGNIRLAGGQTSDIDTFASATLSIGTLNQSGLTIGRTSTANTTIQGANFVNGGVLYGLSGTVSQTSAGALNNCLLGQGSGSAPIFSTCPAGTNWWNQLAGALSPVDINNDFLIGGTATSTAKFSYTGIQSGNTIASVSGNLIVMPNNGWGGQLGIGTTTPTQKLDVAGNINTSAGSAYMYNGAKVITAQTTLNNYFFGNSGNLTMTGINNTANGYQALLSNTDGTYNTANGSQALYSNTTGYYNTANGWAALYSNTTGWHNTANGSQALYDLNITNSTGANTAIGYNTGRGIVTGINNTILGANVTGLSSTLSNNIIIADGAGNQRINVGSTGNVGIGTTTPLVTFDVRGNSGTLAVASISGKTSFASLVVNNDSVGDLFTASSSGTNKFVVKQNGTIIAPQYNTCTLKTDVDGLFTCGVDNNTGVNWWNQLAGLLSPVDINNDFAVGGTSTASAKFSYTGIQSGQTIASISGQLLVYPNNGYGGNASISAGLVIGANSLPTIQTTKNQGLTIGGNTTGNIIFSPNNTQTLVMSPNRLSLTGTTIVDSTGALSLNTVSNQTITTGTGLVTLGGDLQINGNDIQDSGAAIRITLGATTTLTNTTTTLSGTTSLTASSLATIDAAASLSLDSTTLTLGNGSAATIQTTTNGLTLDSGSNTLTVAASDTTLTASGLATVTLGTSATINAGATALNLQADGTPDVNIAGGSSATGCTILNASGNLACSGGIYSTATTGIQGWWNVGSGSLYPTNSTLDFLFGSQASVSARFKLTANNFGAGTLAVASISGKTSFASLVVNNDGVGDLFTASASGWTRFRVAGSGAITSSAYTTGGGIIYATSNGLFSQTTAGSTNECLKSQGGSAPTWGACGTGGGDSFWGQANGLLYPANSTVDLAIGGTASTSAKFLFANVNSGTPTLKIFDSTKTYSLNLSHDGTNGNILSTTGTVNIGQGGGTLYIQTDIQNDGALFGSGIQITDKLNILPVATGNVNSNAALIVNNPGTGDIFTASAGGTTRFNLANTGTITASFYNTCTLKTDSAGLFTCGTDNGGYSPFQELSGAIVPNNSTLDFLVGGQATASADFAITGISNPNNQVNASLSGQLIVMANNGWGGNATISGALTLGAFSNGIIQTTNNRSLTLGGTTTGDIILSPNNGTAGLVNIAGSSLFTTGTGLTTVGGNLTVNGATTTFNNASATLTTGTNQSLTINPNGSGILNLNTSGTGATNIGTSTNTGAVAIGNSTGTFSLTSSGGLNVTTGGALTGVASIDTITTSATALTFAGAGSLAAGGTSNLALDAGTSGAVNIAGVSTGNVNIAGGSSSTGCTIINASGDLACSGGIYSTATTGIQGWWNVASGSLYPTNSTLDFIFGSQASVSARFKLTANNFGAGTLSVASISGKTSFASLVVNNDGVGDLFTASASGWTRFRVANSGAITSAAYTTGGGVIYATSNGLFSQTTAGSTNECLKSQGGSAPTWGACGTGGGDSFWGQTSGLLYPANSTVDLAIGGVSSASAAFLFANVNSGTPTLKIFDSTKTFSLNLSHDGTNGNIISTTGTVNIGQGGGTLYIQTDIQNDSTNNLGAIQITDRLNVLPTATSNVNSNAALIVNNPGTGDIFTASAGGTTRFTLANDGDLTLNGGNVITASSLDTFTTAATLGMASTTTLNLGSNVTINSAATALNLQTNGSIDVNLAGGSGSTGCTIANSTGNLTCSGNISGTSTGIQGYWQRNLGALSPTNITDDLLLGATSTSSSALDFSVTGIASNNPIASLSGNLIVMANNGWGGNVGIGTTAPDGLQINQAVSETARGADNVRLGVASSGTPRIIFEDSGSIQQEIDNTAGIMRFYRPGNISMTINESGRVGIGNFTSGYTGILHVNANSDTNNALVVLNQSGTGDIIAASASGATKFRIVNSGSVYAPSLVDIDSSSYFLDPAATGNALIVAGKVGIATASANAMLHINRGADIAIRISKTGSADRHIDIGTDGSLRFARTGIADDLTIDGAGNVGIGTVTPSRLLEIQTNTATLNSVLNLYNANNTAGAGAGLLISMNNSVGTETIYGGLAATIQDNTAGSEDGNVQLREMINGTLTNVVNLQIGNVGIGTTAPLGDGSDLTLGSAAGAKGTLYLYGSTAGANSTLETTSGNLHIDAASGAFGTYLNYYRGTSGVYFGNGATGSNANVSAAGVVEAGGGLTQDGNVLLNGTDTWFRSAQSGTGWYSAAHSVGIYATVAGRVDTYNSANFLINGTYLSIAGVQDTSGNLRFSAANPYISASSYFVAPGGAYFNSLTVYTEAELKARGGIADDGGNLVLNDSVDITGQITSTVGTNAIQINGTSTGATNVGYLSFYESNGTVRKGYIGDDSGGDSDITLYSDAGSTVISSANFVKLNLTTTAGTYAVCHGGTNGTGIFNMTDCNGSATDIAEFYPGTADLEPGDLVSLETNTDAHFKYRVVKSTNAYDPNIIGVVSTIPTGPNGEILGDSTIPNEQNPQAIGLAGRVAVKVSLENGPIHANDYLTSSSISGVAMKASKASRVIGRAIEDYDGSVQVSSGTRDQEYYRIVTEITANKNPQDPPVGIGKILMFTNPTWFDPDVYITSTGDLNLVDQTASNAASQADFTIPHYFTLNDALGNPIDRVGVFAELAVGNLKAGGVSAKQIITDSLQIATDNVSIGGQSLRDYIATIVSDTISTLASQGQALRSYGDIISPIASIDTLNTDLISPLANNHIEIAGDINVEGSATISGTIRANQAEISGNLTAGDASISGTLRVKKIIADQIEGLNIQAATVSANYITNNYYNSTQSATSNPFPTLIATSIQPSATSSSTNGSLLAASGYISVAPFASEFAYVENLSAATASFSQGLMVFGSTTLSDTSIVGQLSVNGSLILADNSINVLGSDLNLQPLRQGGLSIMAGLIYIDTNGNATFEKDVTVKGTLYANAISPIPGNDLTLRLGNQESGITNHDSQFIIHNSTGSGILAINQLGDLVASGAGTFSKLNLGLVSPALALSPTEVIATGSAGVVTLKANKTQVTVLNNLVTEKSLIYITPVGQTLGQNLYLLRQIPDESFTVGINAPVPTDTKFNFLIIN